MEEQSIVDEAKGAGEIRFLKAKDTAFTRTPGGFLALKISNGESYPRVNLFRSFPFSHPKEYISVRDEEDKEIGIIRNIEDFPDDAVKLFEEEFKRRYFAPVIKKINSVKDEFGYSYWDVDTDAGICRFTVQGRYNVISLGNGRVIISDVDGNRFEIPNYRLLDEKSIKRLEIYL
ncbi:MAG: DUF1854 domain-containing protein [Clostridiales bacterium]|nr:DUF1854 domain-containing protein [Clostridiales bacterium]